MCLDDSREWAKTIQTWGHSVENVTDLAFNKLERSCKIRRLAIISKCHS